MFESSAQGCVNPPELFTKFVFGFSVRIIHDDQLIQMGYYNSI